MFSIDEFGRAAVKWTAALALFALPVGGALAQTLVVRALGPSAASFPPGSKLAAGATVSLRAGDELTLLDNRGTRTLKGPGAFSTTASASGANASASFASLLEPQRVRRARTGAVRGGAAQGKLPRSPNLWYVDISQSANMCVPDLSNVQLWRPDLTQAVTVTAKDESSGKSAQIAFAKGEFRTGWPAALPLSDGARFRLDWPGLKQPVTIRFALMTPPAGGMQDMAAALIAHGCRAQLDLLADAVALPDGQGTPGG